MSTGLRHWATVQPHADAIVCGERHLSYAELESMSNRLAHMFVQRGLERGDHIAMLMTNRPEALAIAWASYRCGLYLTPVPTSLTVTEAIYVIDNCDARLVIVDGALNELAPFLLNAIAKTIFWMGFGASQDGYEALEPLLANASDAPRAHEPPGALMIYTSGTTGAPKGVWRPLPPSDFSGTPAFAVDLLKLFDLGSPDVRYLSTAPLYHAAPLRFALAITTGGGTVFVMERFDAEQALILLETHGITHSQWVPTMFQRMLALPEARRANFKAPAHRHAIHGAAPCSPAVKRAMMAWWGPIVIEYYSGTEGVGLTSLDSREVLRKPGSVGTTKKGVLHVLDEQGHELGPGQTGLIYFTGISPFEYYKAREKTDSKTAPNGAQTFGDIGHVDEDGYLFLTDRQDDMIISGGVNIYPQEIERVIQEVEGVWECAIVGTDDERFGERALAFVVVARSHAEDATVLARIERACETRLGRFKRPSEIRLIAALPRSPTGKLLRRLLKEQV
jgi:long-chain acyl-CoA synthetase